MYEGDFYQGLRHGKGVFCYANGAIYDGEWNQNAKVGYVSCLFKYYLLSFV